MSLANNVLKWYEKPTSRNRWFISRSMTVYVCRQGVLYGDKRITSLAIANVHTPNGTGRGVFTRFLEEIEASGVPIYVENIITKRFLDFFIKRGYKTVRNKSVFRP